MVGCAPSDEPGNADSVLQVLEGSLERITYHNEANGYTVARLRPSGGGRQVTVVGAIHDPQAGSGVKLWGRWMTHQRFGRQFQIQSYREQLPTTPEGIRRYLASGLVKGIGPVTAGSIVDRFGLEALDVLETEPQRLREVPGVGPKRAGQIARAWKDQREIKAIMLFLQSHGVTTGLAVKIFKHYGAQAISVVRHEPYRLARDLFGVGFATADRLARSLGLPKDSPARIEAGIVHMLDQLSGDGHVFAPRPELVESTAQLLAVAPPVVDRALDRLAAGGAVVIDRVERRSGVVDAVYLPPFYNAEVATAWHLQCLLEEPASRLGAFRSVNLQAAMQWVEARLPHRLARCQRDAVTVALSQKISVLTGGPGTGKTTTVRAILALLQTKDATVALAAPTGRAAKRLAEAAGMEAKTIHRLLEFKPLPEPHFARNAENPIPADMIVVDETSMIDALLMNALVRAVDPASHLLLVGDADQLPSVGPGNVLRDLLECGTIPVVRLEEIFRQARRSLIVENAYRINHGEMPTFSRDAGDFFLFQAEDQESAAARIVDVVTNRIPDRFGFDPVDDIQVLSPMHRGPAGVTALNERLRDVLNPPRPEEPQAKLGARSYRLGDKVMQVRNNYDKDVFNGDLGRVVAIDTEELTLTVAFDGRAVSYDYDELDQLVLAFACSTHKSQGAEYPAVVMALLPAHYVMLQRNLLYTGVTRGRRLCVIVGSRRAVGLAVSNNRVASRHSLLGHRLRCAGAKRDQA